MKQFDVFPSPGGLFPERPYFVVIQHALLFSLPNVAILPLASRAFMQQPIADLHPLMRVGDLDLVLMTEEITNLPARLCRGAVWNLADQSERIVRALDLLMGGV